MSISPDFLLQSSTDLRPQAAPAKSAVNQPQATQDKASRFSDVYAKQRQQQASEAGEPAKVASAEPENNTLDASEDNAELAEGGKNLPSSDESLTPELLIAQAQSAISAETALGSLGLNPQEFVEPALPAQLQSDESAEPAVDLDVLAMLPSAGGTTVKELQAQAQPTLSPGALAAQRLMSTEPVANDKAVQLDAVDTDDSVGQEGQLLGESFEQVLSEAEEPLQARQEALVNKLNLLAQAVSANPSVQSRAPLMSGTPLAVGQPGMSEAVVEKVMWLSSQNLKSAEIQLDPAELGRMEVRIELNKDQAAQVTFISASAQVREQLEGQAHRLRELFAQQGMNELDVNVSDQSLAQGSQEQGWAGARRGAAGQDAEFGGDEQLIGVTELRPGADSAPRGLVDFYA